MPTSFDKFDKNELPSHDYSQHDRTEDAGEIIDIFLEPSDLGTSEVIVGGNGVSESQPQPQSVFRKPGFTVFDSLEAASGNCETEQEKPQRQLPRSALRSSSHVPLRNPAASPNSAQNPQPFGYAFPQNTSAMQADYIARAEEWDRKQAQAAKRQYWQTPLILFLLTCLTTWIAGKIEFGADGYLFAFAVMLIFSCHEMGHYLQARRYKVRSSLPYFIPMPLGPIGTLGAIIRMDDRIPNVKALFDIGISGPLAGLVPTVIFCWIGISLSHIGPRLYDPYGFEFGLPLLFDWFTYLRYGFFLPENVRLYLHPFAFAGWVGLLITSLNLFPIGQLDGGHVFYALFKKRSKLYSSLLFYTLLLLVCYFQLWTWSLMLILLALMGHHPPTQNDETELGFFRTCLGVLTLAFIFISFTPNPIRPDFENTNNRPMEFYAQNIFGSSPVPDQSLVPSEKN